MHKLSAPLFGCCRRKIPSATTAPLSVFRVTGGSRKQQQKQIWKDSRSASGYSVRDATSTYNTTEELIRDQRPHEPVYCFSKDALSQQVQKFTKSFSPGHVGYAVKANPTNEIISHLGSSGITHFDIASLPEIAQVRSLVPGATLLYNNPIKSVHEISCAYEQYGVQSFTVDDLREVNKIHDIVKGDESSVQLTVRLKLEDKTAAVYEFKRKFGATETEAVVLLQEIYARGFIPAISFHPGSQCIDPSSYYTYLDAVAQVVELANVPISMVNVGGGFPANYLQCETIDIPNYILAISKKWQSLFKDTDCILLCEPGRALVAESVSLITQVKHIREASNVVYLNDGVYGGFMEQFFYPVELPVRVYDGTTGALQDYESCDIVPYQVFGPTCDAMDRFGYKVPLPAAHQLKEGDWVEFGMMGGYGSATSTEFNGFRSHRYSYVKEGFMAPFTTPKSIPDIDAEPTVLANCV